MPAAGGSDGCGCTGVTSSCRSVWPCLQRRTTARSPRAQEGVEGETNGRAMATEALTPLRRWPSRRSSRDGTVASAMSSFWPSMSLCCRWRNSWWTLLRWLSSRRRRRRTRRWSTWRWSVSGFSQSPALLERMKEVVRRRQVLRQKGRSHDQAVHQTTRFPCCRTHGGRCPFLQVVHFSLSRCRGRFPWSCCSADHSNSPVARVQGGRCLCLQVVHVVVLLSGR